MKPLPDVTLPIVGAKFPNKGKSPTRFFEIAVCHPGDPVDLRLEPENPADEHAVAVYSERGVQMGYIPSSRAVRIGQLIRQGAAVRAVFQAAAQGGGLIRLSFDGSTPDLPPEFPSDPVQDFWPDEEYPDI